MKDRRRGKAADVDAVNEVVDIDASDMESRPAFGANVCSDSIRGVATLEDKFIIPPDADRALLIDKPSLQRLNARL